MKKIQELTDKELYENYNLYLEKTETELSIYLAAKKKMDEHKEEIIRRFGKEKANV